LKGRVMMARLCYPSTAHLQGLDLVYPGGQTQRIRPSWFQNDCLYFLADLHQDPIPFALRDPVTGKSIEFHVRRLLDPARNIVVDEHELSLYFPEQSTFESTPLFLQRLPASTGMYSDEYVVGWREVPLRAPFILNLKPNKLGRPEHLVIVKKDARGRWTYLGSEKRPDGSIFAASTAFGSFCVMADSTPPQIQASNFGSGASIPASQESLVLTIKDDFSGIDHQRILATMDGKWLMFAYDAKTHTITHTFRQRPSAGFHELEVLAYDQANNLGAMRFSLQF
jgi:hypothetical protein